MSHTHISRRQFLTAVTGFGAGLLLPKFSFASTEARPKLITIVLRGAMDGLGAVIPYADPHYLNHRPEDENILADLTSSRQHILDDLFMLHPDMPNISSLYKQKQATIIHATATPYRARSHFDGQDILECGTPRKSLSGWLNRSIQGIYGPKVSTRHGISIGSTTPLIMKGKAPILSWMNPGFKPASDDLRTTLLNLYKDTAPELAETLQAAIKLDVMTGGERQINTEINLQKQKGFGYIKRNRISAKAIAQIMSSVDGPDFGVFSMQGWDTHNRQGTFKGKLQLKLKGLDAVIGELHQQLQPVWSDTTILVVTEFGRTVKYNGSKGTDHGTGTAAFLLGGRVNGGRVIADWPGLADSALHQKRDLRPTTDIRAIIKGVLREQYGLKKQILDSFVFPESSRIAAMNGLLT